MTRLVRWTLIALALAVFAGSHDPVAHASIMVPGDSLSIGSCLQSDNQQYGLCGAHLPSGIGGTDFYFIRWGGFVCDMGLHHWWDSQIDHNCATGLGTHANQNLSAGTGGYALMQLDGNFVLYSGGNTARWATNTYGYGDSAYLNLQDDGNLVVYYNTNIPIWSVF